MPEPRQRIIRVPGSRRVRLTPVAEAMGEPSVSDAGEGAGTAASDSPQATGPNDERLRREVPPHY